MNVPPELRNALAALRGAASQLDDAVSCVSVPDEAAAYRDHVIACADALERVLREPTNVQALALARLIRDREPNTAFLLKRVPDDSFLMANYFAVNIDGTFECGIAPDGGVSS